MWSGDKQFFWDYFTYRFYMKNPKWSILIIVLFLLIVTSLIGVIVMVYVRSMLAFTNRFHDYQQAFYMANAWLELELVKIRNHAFGYQEKIETGSQTVIKNFSNNCIKECTFEAYLKTNSFVLGQKEQISNSPIVCSKEIWYATDGNKLITSLFLFEDATTDPEKEWLLISDKTTKAIKNTNISIFTYWLSSYRLALQATSLSGESSPYDKIETLNQPVIRLLDYQASFMNNISDKDQIRVKIINDLKQSWSVCFQSTAGTVTLPWFHQVINSIGRYGDVFVQLRAIQTNIPWDEQDLAGWSV